MSKKLSDKRTPTIVRLYRTANVLHKKRIPLIPYALQWVIRRLYGADIPYQMEAGNQFLLGHSGLGIVIHARCVIGNNVTIAQHVTIGGSKGSIGVPKIGNNVYIGPGAIVLGDIIIGDNVVIAANAVVLTSIPSNVVVAGVPAKKIRGITDEDFRAFFCSAVG
jgi:serine O-acetyltransferase